MLGSYTLPASAPVAAAAVTAVVELAAVVAAAPALSATDEVPEHLDPGDCTSNSQGLLPERRPVVTTWCTEPAAEEVRARRVILRVRGVLLTLDFHAGSGIDGPPIGWQVRAERQA